MNYLNNSRIIELLVKLRPHAHELPYATLFIENRLTENQTNTKKRLTRIRQKTRTKHLQHRITSKTYSTNVQKQMYRNRENSSNSPTVPARGTTLSTQQNDNNKWHDFKNDNDQMTAITASWFFLSYGKTRQNSIWQRIFHRIFHRKSRAHIDCNNLVWIRPQFQYQIFNTLPRRSRKRRTHVQRSLIYSASPVKSLNHDDT